MKYKLLNVFTAKFEFKNKLTEGINYNLLPFFSKNIIKIDDNNYEYHLLFSLHDHDEVSPYDIDLDIVGLFKVEDYKEKELNEFLKSNAANILLPYLRGILSSTMSSMMLTPIILPIIDVKEILND